MNEATLHDVYLALLEAQGALQHAAELSILCLNKEENNYLALETLSAINFLANYLRIIISALEKVHDNGN